MSAAHRARGAKNVALTIAGSDPVGGAGIQADLRTFAAHGVHGLSAVTCLTVQGTRGVRAVHPVDAAIVRAQIEVVLEDVRAQAMKTGALGSAENVVVVAEIAAQRPRLPLVVDPVLVSTSGAALLPTKALEILRERLLPRATLVTPNVDELAVLLDLEAPGDLEGLREMAQRARRELGLRAVLAKGGHLRSGRDEVVDVLVDAAGFVVMSGMRVRTRCTHGTGCTLSAAITARLARGQTLRAAVIAAKRYVEESLRAATPLGPGKSPMHQLHMLRPVR